MKSSPFSSLITKMNGSNYEMWAMQVKRTLIAHDKEHLILEPEPIQKVGKYGTWFKDNSLVMVWIVGTLSQDIANEVLHKESAKDMWDSLAATYSQARNETRIMQLHHDIHQMRQDGRPLHTYYSSLKSMFERLNSYFPACKCEQQKAYRDMLMVGVFLSGLDSVYESAKNQMLTSPSIPPIDEAYSRLSRILIPAATVPDTTSAMLATRGRVHLPLPLLSCPKPVDPRYGAVYQRRTRPVVPAPCAPVPSPSMPKIIPEHTTADDSLCDGDDATGDDLDMPIAHRKGKRSCTLHPISELSLTSAAHSDSVEVTTMSNVENLNKEAAQDDLSSAQESSEHGSMKYIASHLRRLSDNESEELGQVQRQIRGLLNRLLESNVESIANDVSVTVQSFGRNRGTQMVSEQLASCSRGPWGNDQYAAVFAEFIAEMALALILGQRLLLQSLKPLRRST
ncbi:hypothetical protein EJ110_NYTH05852 [Nymphaea thermarum]|nr:hypothetical protein EJ110_NYTH05852 [Nymphaea thermarum]